MKNRTETLTTCHVPRVAQILDAPSQAAVYQMVARGKLPHRKQGRRIVFFEEELMEFLARQPGITVDEALAAR